MCAGHGAQRHGGAVKRVAKAIREVTEEMRVLLRALMTGTVSRTARASAARRSLKEAVSKLPARRTGSAYEAVSFWAKVHKSPKPKVHPESEAVYATGIWKESHAPYPGRPVDVPGNRLVLPRGTAKHRQETAEVIVTLALSRMKDQTRRRRSTPGTRRRGRTQSVA